MYEIWKMWKVINLLKKNRSTWALALVELDLTSDRNRQNLEDSKKLGLKLSRVPTDKEIEAIMEINASIADVELYRAMKSYHKEPIVKREALTNAYLRSINKEEEFDMDNLNFRKKKIEVQSIIQSCIDDEYCFIKEDPQDKSRIYLTGKGKKFASFEGLVKEEIICLGKTSSIILSFIAGAVGGFAVKNIPDLFVFLEKVISAKLATLF